MNPSILKDGKDTIVNVRNVSYTLHHCDAQEQGSAREGRFQTPWGPLNYVRPDEDPYLRTVNVVGYLNSLQGLDNCSIIDTSKFPKAQEWDFVGHEDGRLVKWDDKIWLTGVRRHAPDGKGRMQLSEIQISSEGAKEVSRQIIEVENKESYCEKNWMPILDMPFHYVKWLSPLEIVKVDPKTGISSQVLLGNFLPFSTELDLRGGSQVVPFKDYRIALTHDVDFWCNEKGDRDSHYNHRMVVWDKDWNLISVTKPWKFMHGKIEFCCGLAIEGDQLLMTFGFQDNSAYLFKTSWDYMDSLPKEVFNE
jgi:hypothetical protein